MDFEKSNFANFDEAAKLCKASNDAYNYRGNRKVASSNMSRVEAHEDFLRLFMKGNFDPYVL